MAWTNFMITIVGVGSIYYLMRRDVRQGAAQLRRNAKTIKGWIEEAEASSSSSSSSSSAASKGEGSAKPAAPSGGEAAPKPPPPSSSSSSTHNKAE